MSSLRFDVTSSPPLRLHVNRGLVRHGYSWVLTDQGPEGPCQVDPTSARIPANLQVRPKTLSTIPVTMEDLGRPYRDRRRHVGLEEQASP
jgi:hypothetical protein